MIYGSGGFNSFGYHGGCMFAERGYGKAQSKVSSAMYLCAENEDHQQRCLYDASGTGTCMTDPTWNDFHRVLAVRARSASF